MDIVATELAPQVARDQWLPVGPLLVDLLPQGLRRGATVLVCSPTLLLALLVQPTQAGSWVAIAGLPTLGLLSAAELGVSLEKCALVPRLDGNWATTIGALIDAVDIVVVHLANVVKASQARQLGARARQRGCVLIVSDTTWPEQPSLELHVERRRWSGIDDGCGYLIGRELQVHATGRGILAQRRQSSIWFGKQRPVQPSPVLCVVGEVS